jgi:hypothetical protein
VAKWLYIKRVVVPLGLCKRPREDSPSIASGAMKQWSVRSLQSLRLQRFATHLLYSFPPRCVLSAMLPVQAFCQPTILHPCFGPDSYLRQACSLRMIPIRTRYQKVCLSISIQSSDLFCFIRDHCFQSRRDYVSCPASGGNQTFPHTWRIAIV